MKFIKRFKLFLESISITNNNLVKGFVIKYNHNNNHDLNDKILKRTNVKDNIEFIEILNRIVDKCISDELNGVYVFISFKYSIKIVTRIVLSDSNLTIVTILGKDEFLKEYNEIIII